MMSSDNTSDLIHLGCQAALRGDGSMVATSLRSTRSIPSGIDLKLLPASRVCEDLLCRLESDHPVPKCNADHALRALLLVPPCYETPWRAAVVLIERLHAQSGWLGESPNAIFAGIADVQTFLHQTLSLWWRRENVNVGSRPSDDSLESTPRYWLLRIAQLALRPLHDEMAAVKVSDNRHWVIPLDLVTTIVSLCQELEGTSSITSQIVLDEILKDPVIKPRSLPVLCLAQDLRDRLRDVDWLKLQSLLKEALESRVVPLADLPGIARSIILLSEHNKSWMPLLLSLLHAASDNMAAYSTLETVIRFSMSSQSTQSLYEWHSVHPTDGMPCWILGNYYLLLFQAARQAGSEIVSRLIRNALGEDEKAYNTVDRCVQSLVCLCLPKVSRDGLKCDVQSLGRFLDGVRYEGEGKFSRRSQPIQEMELTVLVQSLYLGASKLEHRRQKLSAAERAQAWVHVATSMLAKDDFASKATAILIIVAVFCDVPSSRSTLVRSMVGDGKTPDEFDCYIIATLVRSLTDATELQALDPVSSFLSSRSLPFNIFKQLVDAFAHTSFGRESILSFSQKHLYVQNIPWWATIESSGSAKRRQAIQSALYGLCALLVKWDHVSAQAWNILSDFLVTGKPSLPLAVRSWLYSELWCSLKMDKFTASVSEHFLRALLTRLLSYFAWTSVENELTFVPNRAVAYFPGSQEPVVREDLSSLFGLVVELALTSVHDDVVSHSRMEDCQVKLQSICTNQTNISFVFGDDVNSSFYLQMVSSLLASSTCYLFCKANDDQFTRGMVSIAPTLKRITDLIVKEEAKLYTTSLSNDWKEMPKWLDGVSESRSVGTDVVQPPGLYASICRLLSHFMSRAFLHPDSESQVTMALSISKVYGCTRIIESTNREAPDHSPSFIQNVSPETLSLLCHAMATLLNDENTKVEDFRLIMTGIEGVCDDVSSLAQGALGHCMHVDEALRLVGAIALLYRGVASESPISQLLSYLEKNSDRSQISRSDDNALLELSGSGATDRVLHEFRTKVLKAVIDCINNVSNGRIQEVTATGTPNLNIEGVEVLTFLSQLLESTAKDLMEGLRLRSGGITSKMYTLFIEIMETTCVLIQQGGPCLREHKRVDDAVKATCVLFNEIICEFTIPAPLFKKTVHMTTVILPSLRRGYALRCFTENLMRCGAPTAFFKNISNQALQILTDTSSGCEISWSRPSGPAEMLRRDEDDVGREPDKLKYGIPLEISIPSSSVARTALQNNTVIKIANEAAWAHALNALFTAVDRSFALPSLAWQGRDNDDCDKANLLQYPEYLFWRREESSMFLDLVCSCLQQAGSDSKDASHVTVLAQFMPKASKAKFLVILHKVVLVLTKVLRLLMKWIQKDIECAPLARADIVAIVAAWTSDHTFDVIAGARRWFRAERCGSANNHSPDVDVVVVRLAKTMIRVDELESVLQKLDAAIANLDKKNNPQARRLQLMEDAMVLALYNESMPSQLQRNFSLSHAVADCLQSASASRSDGYMNDYAESDRTLPGTRDFGRKRKRQNALARRIRRERKQPILRSRNPVIDLYQQLDYDDAYDDDDDYDDAYADLEGFLVEG